MTTLFILICAVSVVFFVVFLVGCSRPPRKTKPVRVHRQAPESQAVDSPVGRRFFVHLEKQMAQFISVHGRTAAVLLIAIAVLPLMARGQDSSGPSNSTSAVPATTLTIQTPDMSLLNRRPFGQRRVKTTPTCLRRCRQG
jgi:hypothetical protein